jgi:hypothetical protein
MAKEPEADSLNPTPISIVVGCAQQGVDDRSLVAGIDQRLEFAARHREYFVIFHYSYCRSTAARNQRIGQLSVGACNRDVAINTETGSSTTKEFVTVPQWS